MKKTLFIVTALFGLTVAGCSNSNPSTPASKNLKSIYVVNPKVGYFVGDEFVKPEVTALYDDNSTENVKETASFSII